MSARERRTAPRSSARRSVALAALRLLALLAALGSGFLVGREIERAQRPAPEVETLPLPRVAARAPKETPARAHLRAENERLRKTVAALEQEEERMRRRIAGLELALAGERRERTRLEAELARRVDSLERLRAALQAAAWRIRELELAGRRSAGAERRREERERGRAADLPTVAEGVEAYQAGDYARAYRIWLALARAGVAKAQFHLGAMLYEGRLGEPDLEGAREWLGRAVANGYERAEPLLREVEARLAARSERSGLERPRWATA